MRHFFVLLLLLVSGITFAQETHDDIINRPYPQWFKDAKLGIFIHWGLYSVPAYSNKEDYGEWFLRGLQLGEETRSNFMKDHYGEDFTYNDFAPLFKAELFKPTEWAELFKNAGAKYVMFVSKHHDGYALWPSKYSRNWNSMDVGPKRDLVGELTTAVRDAGLKMGLYYSLTEWNNPLHRWYSDPDDQIGDYVSNYMIPQFKELVQKYRPVAIFSDGEWRNSAAQFQSADIIRWYYKEIGSDAIVNNRWGSGLDIGFLTPEYSSGIKITDRPWTEVRGLGRSFGLNRNEPLEAYGTSKSLIKRFVKCVANGGGMILNVGPKADGQIPLIQQERLLQLGRWLKINGQAIYGSEPYGPREVNELVKVSRIDSTINFDWRRDSPDPRIKEDHFTGNWEGFIRVETSGDYKFKLKTGDETTLLIDGKEGKGTSIFLKKNQLYPIKVSFKEKDLEAKIMLKWQVDGKEEVVPTSAFYQDKLGRKSGLNATYASEGTKICFTQNMGKVYVTLFDWPESEVLEIPMAREVTSVAMLGMSEKLSFEKTENGIRIDLSEVKISDLPSFDAWVFEVQ